MTTTQPPTTTTPKQEQQQQPQNPTAHVTLKNIHLTSPLGPDPWHRPRKPQPVTVSIRISYRDAAVAAAEGDDVSKTLDYGKLYKRIEKGVAGAGAGAGSAGSEGGDVVDDDGMDVRVLGRRVAGMGFEGLDELGGCGNGAEEDRVEVWVRFWNGVLLAEKGVEYRCLMGGVGRGVLEEEVRVEGVGCVCVIGVNPHERLEWQRVVVGICFRRKGGEEEEGWGKRVVGCYQEVTAVVVKKVNDTSYQTVEALASYIAEIVTMDFGMNEVTVTVEKPSAIAFVEQAGVEITRTRSFFENRKK